MTLKPIFLTVALMIAVSGCARIGTSPLNPLNWFGQAEDAAPQTAAVVTEEVSDARPLVEQVTALRIERTPTGAIVYATGLPPNQGWHSAALVAVSDGPVDGVLAFRFQAFGPFEQTPVSTTQSRELRAAVAVTQFDLDLSLIHI